MVRRSLQLTVLAVLLAPPLGSCGDEGGVAQVVLDIDRTACDTSCVNRYKVWVHRLVAGGRCLIHERDVSGKGTERFEALSDLRGEVYAGIAAWCPTKAGASSSCCGLLGPCLDSGVSKMDKNCLEALKACPKEADPFGPTAEAYRKSTCGTSTGTECLACQGESRISLPAADNVTLRLGAVSNCAATPPSAAVCK